MQKAGVYFFYFIPIETIWLNEPSLFIGKNQGL